MKRWLTMTALFAAAVALGAQAKDPLDPSSRERSVRAAAESKRHVQAPFTATGRDPLPEILLHAEQESRGPRGACEHAATDLCYDLADRRIVYRPARQYMPRFDGLTPESISLRHDRLIFKYSFK